MGPFVTVAQRGRPFDIGSKASRQRSTGSLDSSTMSARAADLRKVAKDFIKSGAVSSPGAAVDFFTTAGNAV
jgi:hypothetical protein